MLTAAGTVLAAGQAIKDSVGNLMDELGKMRRVIDREFPEAAVRCMLILDATTGQNGLNQAKVFKEAVEINGIILTKLDGTAKGGIAIAIQSELSVPVKYIGIGEKIDDLQKFDPSQFITALFADFSVETEMSDVERLVEADEGLTRDDDLFDIN